jgi:hypothetical protein
LKGFLKHKAEKATSAAFTQIPEAPPPRQFGAGGDCQIWAAVAGVQRARAWGLVYGVYLAKGYAQPDPAQLWYGLHDALPETATFLVERSGQAVAALTVVPDSACGLPADEAFAAELAGLRAPGRRLCEIANLASVDSESHRGTETLNHLFRLAWLVARRLEGATDLVIRVSPQHKSLFGRRLLFKAVGTEKANGGPGGSAGVLMALDLTVAEDGFRAKYGAEPRSLYRFFVDPASESELVEWLQRCRRPLTEITLRRFFVDTKPLIPKAPETARAYLTSCYPDCDLGPAKPEAPPA